ncbi:MFS transporter [Burkholderia alba]|uniref:MFS transporter n=1 Tax=Burkholderia alba TaxID=2683677 RepID=UPI002B05E87F|nr:MFS transporter [Burkholderia alba]
MTQHGDARAATDWPVVLLLWGCGIGAAMQFAKISVSLDPLGAHYGISLAATSLLLSIIGTVGAALGATAGVLVRRWDYRRSLQVALTMGGVISLVQAELPPLPVFFLSRLLEGVSQLIIVIVAPILMHVFSAPRHRAIAMGLWGTFFGVAYALAECLAAPIMARDGVQGVLAAHGALLLVFAAAVLLMIPPDTARGEAVAHPERFSLRGFAAQHVDMYARRATALPGILFFFHTCMFIALLTFVPRMTGGAHDPLSFVMPLFGVIGTLAAGVLAQYAIRPVRLTALCFASVAAAAGGAYWVAGSSGERAAALGLLCMSGLVQGAVFTMVPYLAHDPRDQAYSHGAIAQLGNLGATLGPPVIAAGYAAYGALGLLTPVVALAAVGVALAGRGAR